MFTAPELGPLMHLPSSFLCISLALTIWSSCLVVANALCSLWLNFSLAVSCCLLLNVAHLATRSCELDIPVSSETCPQAPASFVSHLANAPTQISFALHREPPKIHR